MAVLVLLAGLIAWSMWRRGMWFGHDGGTALEYQPPKASAARPAGPVSPESATVPLPGSMPDPTAAHTPNLSAHSLKKPSPVTRLPLARPVPDAETPAAAPRQRHRRHHRDFLGLGKFWHWIRRDHRKSDE
jgi:hypothetical protein